MQEGGDTAMRVKYNRLLHGARSRGAPEPLTTAFLKKFIKYAKNRYQCGPEPPTCCVLVVKCSCMSACLPEAGHH